MYKKCIFLFFTLILFIWGLIFQFNKRQNYLPHQNRILSSLNDRLSYRIKSVDNYCQTTSYVIIILEKGNDNFLLYKDLIFSLGFSSLGNNEYCSELKEEIDMYIESDFIKLVYVYPSSVCNRK